MVKVSKVLMSLAALATVRANDALEPNYPGEPIQPLAPSEPFDPMQYVSYPDPNFLSSLASSFDTSSIMKLASSYISGAPAEEEKQPGYLESAAALFPGGIEALENATKAAYSAISGYLPQGPEPASYLSSIPSFGLW